MGVERFLVKEVPTRPFDDQAPGTSGLRKKCAKFMTANYTENFIQSIISSLPLKSRREGSLVVGGDGRYYCRETTETVIRMAAANHIHKVIVCQNGIGSTPMISYAIRKYSAIGGIILTASHNPGGPDGDFGIKFNTANGGGAPESVTKQIHEISKELSSYRTCAALEVDIGVIGSTSVSVVFPDSEEGTFEIQVIDSTSDYVDLMKSIFDFELVQSLLRKGPDGGAFKINIDARSGVAGPYATAIYAHHLGCPADHLSYVTPLPDFGGRHPDPNLTYAADFVEKVKTGGYDFGAAFDGDADRCMIIGKDSFFVSPSDSLAVIVANAADCIPYFKKRGPLKGVARSMPTSSAIDRVVQVARQAGSDLKVYEVPTGWKFFCNLMDADKLDICGEESFGAGSNHIREKDGVWVSLAWLSILAHHRKGVKEVMEDHWHKYGRNFYTRYDYEDLSTEQGTAVMNKMKAMVQASERGTSYATAETKYVVQTADNFSYKDPVDGSSAHNQGYRLIFTNSDRIIVRLSGTGSSGATVRIYMEHFETDSTRILLPTETVIRPLVHLALLLTDIGSITGRDAPTVIT